MLRSHRRRVIVQVNRNFCQHYKMLQIETLPKFGNELNSFQLTRAAVIVLPMEDFHDTIWLIRLSQM